MSSAFKVIYRAFLQLITSIFVRKVNRNSYWLQLQNVLRSGICLRKEQTPINVMKTLTARSTNYFTTPAFDKCRVKPEVKSLIKMWNIKHTLREKNMLDQLHWHSFNTLPSTVKFRLDSMVKLVARKIKYTRMNAH